MAWNDCYVGYTENVSVLDQVSNLTKIVGNASKEVGNQMRTLVNFHMELNFQIP